MEQGKIVTGSFEIYEEPESGLEESWKPKSYQLTIRIEGRVYRSDFETDLSRAARRVFEGVEGLIGK